MTFTTETLTDFAQSSKLEWLETNGLGGYASSSVSGALTRRYHGLLIAALNPPVERTVLLSKLDETIVVHDQARGVAQRIELSSNQYPGAVHPSGHNYLVRFERRLFPEFTYAVGGIVLKKTCAAIHGEPTTVILYEVEDAPSPFGFELIPLASARDHHSLCKANTHIGRQYLFGEGVFRTINYQGGTEIFISVPGSEFEESQGWYYNFEYLREQERGLEFREDLYSHGRFKLTLRKGDRLGIIVSTEDPTGRNAIDLIGAEQARRKNLGIHTDGSTTKQATARTKKSRGNVDRQHITRSLNDDAVRPDAWSLIHAADQFIVRRGSSFTIIAGYPWFSDWGRDTMIALPGLCLTTGRFDVAAGILRTFVRFLSEGMLPNRFPDHGELPEYNTIDATLWFFQASYHYYLASQDIALIRELMPALSDIVTWHRRGTRYGIMIDPEDHLLRGGMPGVQLTWMDAKVGEWVVTPRIGKPVEVNALWYNALCILEVFHTLTGNAAEARVLANSAAVVRESFQRHFWNDRQGCLYDYIDESPHAEVRPNQLYAISLPFPLLDGDTARKVVGKVRHHLVTPVGLRSLAPDAPEYKGQCTGGVLQRDAAYHQGTVWSYLLGAYVDAIFAAYGDAARDEASRLVERCAEQLNIACVGSINEIFDGDAPHLPRGCIAQAWTIGELLRVKQKYNL